jgi:hypothetical protein
MKFRYHSFASSAQPSNAWDIDAECLRSLGVDNELKLGRLMIRVRTISQRDASQMLFREPRTDGVNTLREVPIESLRRPYPEVFSYSLAEVSLAPILIAAFLSVARLAGVLTVHRSRRRRLFEIGEQNEEDHHAASGSVCRPHYTGICELF